MEIKTYFGEYDDEIISLILDIQNKKSGLYTRTISKICVRLF